MILILALLLGMQDTVTVQVGSTVYIAQSVNARSLRWTSSDPAVASVDRDGMVRGISIGTARITASSNRLTDVTVVRVIAADAPLPPPVEPVDTVLPPAIPPPIDATAPDFNAVIQGVRPRGYGTGTYTPLAGTLFVGPAGNDANACTFGAPCRTINRAAQVAAAGDVVTIADGTYQESVLVKNSGTATAPIVFQAASRGGVILTGGQYVWRASGWTGKSGTTPQRHVTVRGLVFRQYAGNATNNNQALRASYGWTVDDCLFDNAGWTAIAPSDHNITITRTTVQYSWVTSILSYGGYSGGTSPTDPAFTPLENLRITDTVLRGNHVRDAITTLGGSESVMKIAGPHRGVLIDNVESYENFGSGIWLDQSITDYVVRNSYLHHNKGITGTKIVGDNGRGLYLEKVWGPGLVENNVIRDNAGAGAVLVNSSYVTMRGNLLVNNESHVQMLNVTGAGYELWTLKNVTATGNLFKGWRSIAAIWARGGDFSAGAKAMRLLFDGSTYDRSVNSLQLASFPAPYYGAKDLAEMQSKHGWEYSGKIGAISF